ncbi:hypothetical protein MKK64_17485 [Methylobacterium sp. E-025]|uniref:hypothetical protein n=1 Tax=Methylobacterium sp. E-025 TaxID=2836561 RepID=UPI001FB88E3F|nr:hypothetical protein [Methylobacterium sp. E-025]MCJ2112976.1 hypothetical protein [Methylobacterium sp. E-025]
MKQPSILIAAVLTLSSVAPALSLDRVLSAPRIRDNGDIRLSDDLRIGRKVGSTYVATPDALQIQGPGSTGDVSGTSVTAQPGDAAQTKTLGGWLADVGSIRRPAQAGSSYGYAGDGMSQRYIIITGDNIDMPAAGLGGIAGRAFRVAHTVGGPNLKGGRIAGEFSLIHNAPDSPANTLSEFVGLTGSVYGTSQGGFGGQSLANPRGSLFAGNSYVETQNGYTNLANVTSHEFNLNTLPGSSMFLRQGIQVVSRGAVRGTVDTAIGISAGGTGGGTRNGITFGDQNSYGIAPIDANGTLIGSYTSQGALFPAAVGIDLTAFGFSDSILKAGGMKIAANGSVSAGLASTAGQVQYDFRTSGTASPFDVRIAASGGSATAGSGNLALVAGLTQVQGAAEFTNVPRTPAAVGTYTIAADTSAVYIRVRFADGVYRATLPLTKETGTP